MLFVLGKPRPSRINALAAKQVRVDGEDVLDLLILP